MPTVTTYRSRLSARTRFVTAAAAITALLIAGVGHVEGNQRLDRKIREKYRRATLWGLRTAPEIEVEEAMILLRRGDALLVDARTEQEREVSIIPGAITIAELSSALAARTTRAPVIVYCTIGARSATTTRRLVRQGVEARNLVGGVLAWAHAGGTFERDGEPTQKVHVYGPSWDLLPEGFESTW